MLRTTLFSLVGAALLAVSATAQRPCSDNLWPLRLVDRFGAPAPSTIDPDTNRLTYHFANEEVYLAFDPTLPSGTYYVTVTAEGLQEVVATNDPMDRFVTVTNTGGVITLSLPFSSNPDPALFGVGLGGQGQSILLKFRSSSFTPCRWKALIGDKWDMTYGPDNPYLLDGGVHPTTGECAVRSYDGFTIGDGNGSDVTGVVFRDQDRDGVRDPGEVGLSGWPVKLVTEDSEVTTQTDGNGNYRFENVAAGQYSVEVDPLAGFVSTTAASLAITVCDCADLAVAPFGAATVSLPCNARPPCFWRSKSGLSRFRHFHLLPAMHLSNGCGAYVAPGNHSHFASFLGCGSTWNMANMLSCQLLAMNCNVLAGYVHPDCVIQDPCLGTMTIAQLLQCAMQSLACDPYTPPWHHRRHGQTNLKNALERANDNRIWR